MVNTLIGLIVAVLIIWLSIRLRERFWLAVVLSLFLVCIILKPDILVAIFGVVLVIVFIVGGLMAVGYFVLFVLKYIVNALCVGGGGGNGR